MKTLKSSKWPEFFKFIWKNCLIFLIVLSLVLLFSISYIGLAYTFKSPNMLSCAIEDYRLPFQSYGEKLYAKLYWDATLKLSKNGIHVRTGKLDSLRKIFDYSDLFNSDYIHEYAAEKGNMNAQFYVGNNIYLYSRPQESEITRGNIEYHKNLANKKIMWLSKASDQGHIEAIDTLGALYEKGALFFQPDTIKALKYYTKAAEKGDMFALTKKGLLLIASNDTTGLRYLRSADSKGYVPATVELGKFYYPMDTPSNPYADKVISSSYFQKAKDKDNTGIANYYLGLINGLGWINGHGSLRLPLKTSMDYFLKGAQQGYNPSRYMLGYLTVELRYKLETPPYQYMIESFDKLRRNSEYQRWRNQNPYSKDNIALYESRRDNYSTYCGWAWIIIAAEDGYDEAINYIEGHKDNTLLRKVLSCRNSKVETIIVSRKDKQHEPDETSIN